MCGFGGVWEALWSLSLGPGQDKAAVGDRGLLGPPQSDRKGLEMPIWTLPSSPDTGILRDTGANVLWPQITLIRHPCPIRDSLGADGDIPHCPHIAPPNPQHQPATSAHFLPQNTTQGSSQALIPPEFPPKPGILDGAGGDLAGERGQTVTSPADGDANVFSSRWGTPQRPPPPPNSGGHNAGWETPQHHP